MSAGLGRGPGLRRGPASPVPCLPVPGPAAEGRPANGGPRGAGAGPVLTHSLSLFLPLRLRAQTSPSASAMEETPGAAAKSPGVEFGSAERDVIRVPSHLALEVISSETRTGQHVPSVLREAISIGSSKTSEGLLQCCPAYKNKPLEIRFNYSPVCQRHLGLSHSVLRAFLLQTRFSGARTQALGLGLLVMRLFFPSVGIAQYLYLPNNDTG